MNNNHPFHIAAFTRVRGSYIWGTNSYKESAKFKRRYMDGTYGYHLHAEMELIKNTRNLNISEISVIRFKKDGSITMAKPCRHCQRFLKDHGVSRVNYTNWDGEWDSMSL